MPTANAEHSLNHVLTITLLFEACKLITVTLARYTLGLLDLCLEEEAQ